MILLLIPLLVGIGVAIMFRREAADDVCKRCGLPYWGVARTCTCERSKK